MHEFSLVVEKWVGIRVSSQPKDRKEEKDLVEKRNQKKIKSECFQVSVNVFVGYLSVVSNSALQFLYPMAAKNIIAHLYLLTLV